MHCIPFKVWDYLIYFHSKYEIHLYAFYHLKILTEHNLDQ